MQNAFPPMVRIRQKFDCAACDDVCGETINQMVASGVRFHKGSRIAVAVGSRGIASIADVVRSAVHLIQQQGAEPFIIPAMGSHGGATADGQREVLCGYGIDERTMGCPVVSSMDVIPLETQGSPRVYMAKDAYLADGVVVVNRVKPHTDFHGPVESGLVKMLVVGLGKHAQALEMHSLGVPGLRDLIRVAARRILATGKIMMGIGIVENAYDQVHTIRACAGKDIFDLDQSLLTLAREHMASLPVDSLDLLLVDWIGKDISGTGMDTNIIGRMRIPGETEPESPRIQMIIADGLTPASHGNALGIGLADIVTEKLFQAMDRAVTAENVVTSGFLERGRVPVCAKDARQAANWALHALHIKAPDRLHAARIHSTLHITQMQVTQAVLESLQSSPVWEKRQMERIGAFESIFLENGELVDRER